MIAGSFTTGSDFLAGRKLCSSACPETKGKARHDPQHSETLEATDGWFDVMGECSAKILS
jgi:hypothetical protein